ncbi:type IV pili methyl-accepting chemotaxis transducer N-terminal domain-containing protein [Thiomonas sp. FB-6]|uniref:type IV pili methyl-accepting chemotaxis transducer N-terminal domain-containing protein n=1 Tax=Thiomonas sp. FB-6 TaxID=1158291 RepID=UPI0003655DC4|nr:type IV pili methyl-accepting chemotaxis transducer N-terminal domain-containing protein [Thiomonas sp. FB-6]
MTRHRWTLSSKISLFAGVFLLLSLLSVGATLWISWKLQGGAGAVNVAGQLRMMSYRLELSAASPRDAGVDVEIARMQQALELLGRGDLRRPLAVPWDPNIRARFAVVRDDWERLRPRWSGEATRAGVTRAQVDRFVGDIDDFVRAIERRLDFWTAQMHTAQMAMGGFVLVAFMAMFFLAYLHVLEPVGQLARGVEAIAAGNLDARVRVGSSDELGDLALGFNRMAVQLQAVRGELEERVRQKTAALETERQRLAALYEVSALVSRAPNLEELAHGFTRAVRRIAGADAAVLRWTDETAQRYLLLAAEGMPGSIVEDERCLNAGACHCGGSRPDDGVQVVRFRREADPPLFDPHTDDACVRAGFTTLLSVPVAVQKRALGEVDLFYRGSAEPDAGQHALLDALADHLAAAMESLRGAALEREAAVARERALLARELHDSIAQALAFMKIQLQLLRGALRAGEGERVEAAVGELDAGIRESLADVRELLLHFRTRTQEQDIEPALRSTLQKFEVQSGLGVRLRFSGRGQPLDADVQVQVLHVVQEALSNVRKHAQARHVDVSVESLPSWAFTIADDGRGLDPQLVQRQAQSHVGLQIMRERAAAIGATLELRSMPGAGTTVSLRLPEMEMLAAGAGARMAET